MSFSEFLKRKQQTQQDLSVLNESFKESEVDKVHQLMLSIFRKKISNKVFMWDWLTTEIDGKQMKSFYFIDLKDKAKVWSLNYLISSKNAEVYSISFFDELTSHKFLFGNENNYKAKLTISTLGTSIAYFIPIICSVVKNGLYDLNKEDAKKLGNEIFKENKQGKFNSYIYNFGPIKYEVFENLTNDDIEKIFNLTVESLEVNDFVINKRKERDAAWNEFKRKQTQSSKDKYLKIKEEYKKVLDAVLGGVTDIEELKMSLSKNKPVIVKQPADILKLQQEFEKSLHNNGKELSRPEQAFKEMAGYIKMVLKGIQPGVILCGSSGIGKTYRVKEQLAASGYVDGVNMEIIKGKCTPRQLYISLYNNKEKGKLLLIDDADSLVGPKAPEDCINMLKAALDSTADKEGRKVVYKVSGNLLDNDGNVLPKSMYYNGGVIVITNYSAGQLDTAFRGRTFIQSLHFTNDEILELLEGLLPKIKDGNITEQAKHKALKYLKKLSKDGSEMELSIRTFTTCAKIFTMTDEDQYFSDADAEKMIKHQMYNQALRGGEKY